jgi:hypothetical protein
MTAPVSVSCSKQTKSLTQTGLRSISGIGTDRRAVLTNPINSRLVGYSESIVGWRKIAITRIDWA